MLKSIEGNFENPDVNQLLLKHFVELKAASPEGSAHVLDIQGLKERSIRFWSLWEKEKLIGCGALKFLKKDHGEFKSIRIHDEFRNKGFGIKIINHLIDEAKKLGIKRISIETGAGKFFEPARRLFKKCNFIPCKPFAHYKEDENSIYLTKLIIKD
ncbi:GNAT family N-acetyltransferase [Candidatus Pelagibacter sp.]|nr:GNAT family N-acetyltransferase [Candidatus Pelagibacter sp.]|tara:strand:- start:144 stop:611 length:468 start_codon:yes stop_codon:yes gene_type:complete